MSSGTPVAGWYTDPYDQTQLRWWDGQTWTSNTRPRPDYTAPAAAQQEESPQTHASEEPVEPESTPEPEPEPEPTPEPEPEPTPEPEPSQAAEVQTSEAAAATAVVAGAAAGTAAHDYTQSPDAGAVDEGGQTSADIEQLATGKKSRKGLWITLLVILVVLLLLVGAGAAWYFFKPTTSSSPAPSPSSSSSAAAGCQQVVTALTADGTTSNLVGRLTATANNADIPGAVQYFTAETAKSAPILATSGTACLASVAAQESPLTYSTFIAAYAKALKDGVAISSAAAATNQVTPEQASTLNAAAKELTDAAIGVGVTPSPPALPAPPPPAPTALVPQPSAS